MKLLLGFVLILLSGMCLGLGTVVGNAGLYSLIVLFGVLAICLLVGGIAIVAIEVLNLYMRLDLNE